MSKVAVIKSEKGGGEAEFTIIAAFVIYMTFMSYLMFAVYGNSIPTMALTDFNQPSWLNIITGVWLVWVFEIIANFFILLTFTIIGHGIPLWLNAFFTLPFLFGIGWMILSLIRGR